MGRYTKALINAPLIPITWLTTSLFGQAPTATAPTNFQHVVVIFQENRTPDNLFQGLCSPPYGAADSCSTTPGPGQYNIQTSDWLDKSSPTGKTHPVTIPLANAYDLSHAHSAFVAQCDLQSNGTCAMDGAAKVTCSGTCPTQPQFRYVENAGGLLNPYLSLATQYGWANNMFQTNQGPSFPAHQFIFGGTSAPSAADDQLGIYAAENMSGTATVAGCTADSATRVRLVGPDGTEKESTYPCFEHQTMSDILPQGITWRYYAPSAGSIWTAPNAIAHICKSTGPGGKCVGNDWTANVDLTPAHVLTDIGACKLRSLTWVIPSGLNSDHANSNDGGGPSWVASIVNAIGTNTTCDKEGYWKDTAIVITWDDWGGWYDHVPPTVLPSPFGGYQLGFRVPLIFVSAYTKAGYINNDRHDFGDILRFAEGNFGLRPGALGFADSRSTNQLSGFYDLSQAPRAFTPTAALKSASFFIFDKRPATDPDNDGDEGDAPKP
jgi:phospholipase C